MGLNPCVIKYPPSREPRGYGHEIVACVSQGFSGTTDPLLIPATSRLRVRDHLAMDAAWTSTEPSTFPRRWCHFLLRHHIRIAASDFDPQFPPQREAPEL
ncbi:hypothetical protein TNCV_1951831 [Trichonephila clavipes]|nr:hypothetical protein TNCV_1951831 [Trichonephila clavipes]